MGQSGIRGNLEFDILQHRIAMSLTKTCDPLAVRLYTSTTLHCDYVNQRLTVNFYLDNFVIKTL